MNFYGQKLYLQIILLFTVATANAQENWPSPEIEQMYYHAQEYAARGDFNSAITTCKQAISLAPGKFVLYKELGNALYLSGKYKDAAQILTQVCTKPEADAACYQLLSASHAEQGDTKEAISTLQRGLGRFPASGILYHEKGKVLLLEVRKEAALNAWLDGIDKDPEYAPDYYEAAITYLGTDNVMWGLLYGEMFLDMKHDTLNDELIKNKLFTGYKTMFDGFATEVVPGYGKATAPKPAKTFESAVLQVYSQLTPVVSDGISTENLTMVRTRFLMDWFSAYGSNYPLSLFSYQDSLLKYGRFDIWNEWLFGKAESATEYNAWNTFHDGAISRTRDWQSVHLLHPVAQDSYNDRNMAGMFDR